MQDCRQSQVPVQQRPFWKGEGHRRHIRGFNCSRSSGRRRSKEDGDMEDWDQEQLEKVIADKHAKEKSNATAIICKFFLDAVENKQYGWCAFI